MYRKTGLYHPFRSCQSQTVADREGWAFVADSMRHDTWHKRSTAQPPHKTPLMVKEDQIRPVWHVFLYRLMEAIEQSGVIFQDDSITDPFRQHRSIDRYMGQGTGIFCV